MIFGKTQIAFPSELLAPQDCLQGEQLAETQLYPFYFYRQTLAAKDGAMRY
jgi:hypothetical protein